jgi:hypothetical protein
MAGSSLDDDPEVLLVRDRVWPQRTKAPQANTVRGFVLNELPRRTELGVKGLAPQPVVPQQVAPDPRPGFKFRPRWKAWMS